MCVIMYYTTPGVRILNSLRLAENRNRASALHKRTMHLHLISRYPRGVVGRALDCHLNVSGSIPTPTMIFILGFYQCSSFYFERDRERED
jgi:hypothetical protein